MNTIDVFEELGMLMVATALSLSTSCRTIEKAHVASTQLESFPFEHMVWLKRRMTPLLFIGGLLIMFSKSGLDLSLWDLRMVPIVLKILGISWVGYGFATFIAWPVQRWLFTEARGKPISAARGLKAFVLLSTVVGLLLWVGSLFV